MEQPVEPLTCAVCRVLIIDGVHPAALREKFSNVVCDQPQPGRPAKPREAAFGRGDSHRSDKFSLQDQLDDVHLTPGAAAALATNGSYRVSQARRGVFDGVSWGYLATTGAYGLGTAVLPATAVGLRPGTHAELRGIWRGLPRLVNDHPVLLISNSTRALNLITAWMAGHRPMPSGYDLRPRLSGRQPTLIELADLVEANADRIDTMWVRPGSGMPLNEGAHSLARISQAWASRRLGRPQVAGDARRVARRTLLPGTGPADNSPPAPSRRTQVPGRPGDHGPSQAAISS